MKIRYILIALLALAANNSLAQEGSVVVNQDDEIVDLLKLKKDVESSSERFKIQIFSGSSRSSAESARAKFIEKYADIDSSLEYETPNYKIWVGNFRSRLEADRALMRIKRTFNNAFIFKPKTD